MERLDVEIPVSVGDKVYRTTSNCDIQAGEVTNIKVISEYYMTDGKKLSKVVVKFTVSYGYCNTVDYEPKDLGLHVFPTRKGLIKHIVGEL